MCVRTCTHAHTQSLSRVRLFETLWTIAHQAPLFMGFSRQEYWVGCHFLLQGSSQIRNQTHVSCIGRWFFTTEPLGPISVLCMLWALCCLFQAVSYLSRCCLVLCTRWLVKELCPTVTSFGDGISHFCGGAWAHGLGPVALPWGPSPGYWTPGCR